MRFAKDERLRREPRMPCTRTAVGTCDNVSGREYFTMLPWTNSKALRRGEGMCVVGM
jgi:hypothetical protein